MLQSLSDRNLIDSHKNFSKKYPPLHGEDILLTFNRTYANISLLIDKNKKVMQNLFNKLFGSKVGFSPIDPLADGLAEEIIKEQRESQAIRLDADEIEDIRKFWSRADSNFDD